MKSALLVLSSSIFFLLSLNAQSGIPSNFNINKTVLTIANFSSGKCGFVNSKKTNRGFRDIEDLVEVIDNTGAYDLGTGFVYVYQGEKYIITCEHVIFKSDSIVGYDKNYKPYALELVGGDTFYDIAVLKFKNKKDASNWEGAEFDFTPKVSGNVFAVGYWMWSNKPSWGAGKLLGNKVALTDRRLPIVKLGFLRSNAHTDSGYSGGPLFDSDGQVIGMHNMVHVDEKISFALNSKIILRVAQDIIDQQSKEVQRAYLGIQFTQEMDGRVMINKVLENSPAAKFCSDLEGKEVFSIAGQTVLEIYDILTVMEKQSSGNSITLEMFSNEKILLTLENLDDKAHEQIAYQAVKEQKDSERHSLMLDEENLYLKTINKKTELVRTGGLKDNRIYCINNLAQLGKLVRIFSLHGSFRIGFDEDFNRGRWVQFSDEDDLLVLYY